MFKNKKLLYFIYGLIIVLLYLGWSYNPLVFNDYPWHIKAGEWMVQNKQILTHNIFSHAIPETTIWYSHEWLAEVIMYLSLLLFKVDYAFIAISIPIIIFTLIYSIKSDLEDKDLFSLIFISILIIISFSTSIYARPFVFSFLFWIILVKELDNIKRNKNSKIYLLLPLITIFWTNTHGGTVLFAILAPIGYFICGKFNFTKDKFYAIKSSKNQEKKYIYLMIGNFLASLINPFTYKIYLFPFIINNPESKNAVHEWAPASIEWPVTMITIILVIFFILLCSKKIEFTDASLLGSFILITLVFGRFYSWLAFAAIIIIPKYLKEKENDKYKFEFTVILYIYILFFTIFNISIIIKKDFPQVEKHMNPIIIEKINELKPERLYNSYDSGAMLIYYGKTCYVNSIGDLYDEATLKVGRGLKYLDVNIYEIEQSKDYYFDVYLIEKGTKLYTYLKNTPEKYKLIYEEEDLNENSEYLNSYAIFKNIIKKEELF